MNQQAKREVVATLIKAGRKDLAEAMVTAADPASAQSDATLKVWRKLQQLEKTLRGMQKSVYGLRDKYRMGWAAKRYDDALNRVIVFGRELEQYIEP